MRTSNFNKLPFNVSKWLAWSPAFKEVEAWQSWATGKVSADPLAFAEILNPPITFLPIGMRKKLSDMCKLVLYLSHHVLEGRNDIRIVICSRLGESQLTLELLESIGKREIPSPMVFSRSVMNSSAGLFSIFSNNNSSSVCVSAMEQSFPAGLFEALLQLHAYQQPVLFLYIEEKLPDIAKPFIADPPVSYGMAFLLEKGEQLYSVDNPEQIKSLDFLRGIIKQQH